ncbi:MAG: hypothetical protein HZA21_01220 [Nitrospirae bacterium]|nr:hypothetical protein [Nitrospirota bacterium]
MLKDPALVEAFERDLIRRTPPDHLLNLRLFEALWEHARRLGNWPPADPLDGLDGDLRLAHALNVHRTA